MESVQTNTVESLAISDQANGLGSDKSHNAIEFVQKVDSLAFSAFFKPHDGFVDFLLSECEELDVH
jgi:hypothetical protein